MDKKHTKARVTALVQDYATIYPEEYALFKSEQKVRQDSLGDKKYAEVKGIDVLDRKLGEIPETLFVLFNMKLNEEELRWLLGDTIHKPSAKGFNEGPRWFFKTFKEFRSGEEI